MQPRWGKVGKQRIEDCGTLYPERMETVDDEILEHASKFIDKAKNDGKPFFMWLNPTRMHVVTHLSEKYEKMRNAENGWGVYEAGMAQLDDIVGTMMAEARRAPASRKTRSSSSAPTTARRTSPGPTADRRRSRAARAPSLEGGFRAPCILRWPGKVQAGTVENGMMSGLDWFPTFLAAAGKPNIVDELKQGATLGGKKYKVAPRRLQPARFHHGQVALQAQGDLLLRGGDAGRRAHRRLQVQVHRPAERLARRHREARLAA